MPRAGVLRRRARAIDDEPNLDHVRADLAELVFAALGDLEEVERVERRPIMLPVLTHQNIAAPPHAVASLA